MQGKWALVTVDVTPVQPQWVGCCHGGAKSSRQSRRVAAAVVVQCPIFCWQIKSPEPLNAAMLLDEHKIRGGRVSSPEPAPQGQLPPLQYIHRIATSSPAQGPKGQGSLPEWPRRNIAGSGENRQVVLCCTVVGESAPAEEVPRSGGVLNAAKLTQDWPRGKAFPTGWQGQACSGAFNAEFILISCKCLL
ncbi:uncharacterized protein TrAtP1_008568 [Trichoderma atroviride]|uniref:uncharacterized protein n=1 Tax=Hypocrea atroviridis TaxID=63577 RepID=UPI00332529D3|nr:hypothetical protein TrAtP1_008568 [Trichoderma atroviride]